MVDAHEIVVLEAGRVVEQGPPAELLAAGGLVWFGATLLRRTRHLDMAQAPAVPPAPSAAARPTARDILDERLARGEIDVDDYHQRIAALAGPGSTGTPADG